MHSNQATNASIPNSKRLLGFDLPYLLAEWKEIFNLATIPSDLWAGITVALVALPLNLALAIAAGVEPGIGITTGIVAGIIASLFGGQKYAVTGPAAAMAVVLIEIAHTYGIAAIWLIGIMAGLLQMLSGTLRLGKLISFIPMPVIVGFSNAIGILVIFNSLDDFLGLPSKPIAHVGKVAPLAGNLLIPEFIKDIISLTWNTVVHQQWNMYAVAIGSLVVALAILVPKWTRVIPGQLVAIVVASIVAAMLNFHLPRIIDISSIPTSLPMPHWPTLPWEHLDMLFTPAITVFMLGSIESLLSASVADGMTMSRRHHSDQELIGQGMANVITPLFGGIPVTGVIARTAVNIRAGAKTRLSGIVHALILMLLGFTLAKQAEQIPLAALAGILILTGARLIEWDATKQIWHASRMEGLVVALTTSVSVLMDLTAGVVTGLILTCGLFIKQMSAVKVIAQDYDPDRRAQVRQPVPSCKLVRTFLVDGPLFFGAAERFTETILITQNLKGVILHMKAVSAMDLTGIETLLSINAQLKRNGIQLVLAELPHQPFELLKRTGALEEIGRNNCFKDFREAILSINQRLLETSCHACAASLKGDEVHPARGPKDCKLRSAIILNTDQMANIMRDRLSKSDYKAIASQNDDSDRARLIAIESSADIPDKLRGTPIEELIKCQNFYEVSDDSFDQAGLIVGMCIDYRKQLHLPKNCAYIIRSPGANMQDSEFSIALALASGIQYMALVVHNKCLMSDPDQQRAQFINTLTQEHGWARQQAEVYFDRSASNLEIDDAIDFALEESSRLLNVFRSLMVVPLYYNVDNDRIFLIKDWLVEQEADVPFTKI